jgi:hypothetical protein
MPAASHNVDDLVPRPFSLEQIRLAVEQRTGRRLALEPAPLAGAMLISTHDADLIIYDQAADADRQLRVIGHEAAHLLLGHEPHERPSLFTHLDPAVVAETVTFHGYSPADEREADDFARLLVSAASSATTATARQSLDQPDRD